MKSQEVIRVPLRLVETITDEIQEMFDEITRRAYELFQERGGNATLDQEDWLTAEREVVEKPRFRVDETANRIIVTVYISDLNALELQILVSPDAMLIHGGGANRSKKLFRVVQFPRRIDATKAEAHYGDGCLVLTA